MHSLKTPTDKDLLKAVRDHHPEAWTLVFAEYDPLILAIVRWPKWNFSADEQQDVAQNIRMHLQSALPTFKQKSSLRWFIKQIAMHQCIDEIRRQKRWRTFMTPLVQQTADGQWNEMEFNDPDIPDPHEETVMHERHEKLYSSLKRMPQTCRDSISMFYLQHMTYKEMSAKLGIAVNTVGSRLAKCLDKLQQEIKKKPLKGGTAR